MTVQNDPPGFAQNAPIVMTDSGPVAGVWRGFQPLCLAATPTELLLDAQAKPTLASGEQPFAAFLGIPYAKPPVGELRFAAPEAPLTWDDTLPCVQYGPTPLRKTADGSLVPEPAFPGDATLNLNVFTPDPNGEEPLPVLFYIHGGAFTAGSPASPWYDGRTFNRSGVVVVTASYRLGVSGFGQIEGAVPNRGVLDWLAALEWVQRNIHAFGGDPADVTIAGQSAGGAAVLTLLGMESAQHLFSKAWSISGVLSDIEPRVASRVTGRIAKMLGARATTEGFGAFTPTEIQRAEDGYLERAGRNTLWSLRRQPRGLLHFGPVVDGEIISRTTLDSVSRGVGAGKPLLLGSTADEWGTSTGALPRIARHASPRAALRALGLSKKKSDVYMERSRRNTTPTVIAGYLTDISFRAPVVEVASARGNAPTWLYSFEWGSAKQRAAIHCSDLPFWFNCLDQPYATWLLGRGAPTDLAEQMHQVAVNFVGDGNPGWPATRPGHFEAMIFDGTGQGRIDHETYSAAEVLVRS